MEDADGADEPASYAVHERGNRLTPVAGGQQAGRIAAWESAKRRLLPAPLRSLKALILNQALIWFAMQGGLVIKKPFERSSGSGVKAARALRQTSHIAMVWAAPPGGPRRAR